jgi:UDP-glucose 4-epimerase
MANILITGGAGNVASSLAERFSKDESNTVVVVDNLSTGERSKVPTHFKNCKFIEADANDYDQLVPVFEDHNFDYVFHYAAVVGVLRTLENPINVLHDIEGFKHMLDLSVKHNVKRFIFSSSSEVYGEPVEIPQIEDTTPLNAKLPYAIVKSVGESFLKSYQQMHGLDYTIFRFFNTYGPKQSTDFVISKFISQAKNNEDITIYGDGSQTRTFCYIDDNTEFTEHIINNDLFINDTVNVGSDLEMTIKELAERIIEILKSDSKIIYLPALKEGDMKRRCPDISKMKSAFGRELTTLEEGILKTAKHH